MLRWRHMRHLALAVGMLGALAACQQGDRYVGAIAPRPASERAAAAQPPFDYWAPRDPSFEIPWAEKLSTDAEARAHPSAFDWEPGHTVELALAAREPIAAATSGPVVSAMTSNQSFIAVTEDATAAVTVDITGSARLWPTLDGTREPVVIALHAADRLAVVHDGDELVVASIDHAGQLELLRLAPTGESRGHAWVESPRPLTQIWFAGKTLLALRDDHALAGFDVRGAQLGVLVSDPGEHIATLAVRSGRALAILDAEGAVRGRWVGIGPALAWGDVTPPLPVLSRDVVLTPDGTQIAGVNATRRAILIVDVGAGKIVRRALRRDDPDPFLHPAGFLTDHVLAMGSSFASLEWWGREAPDTSFRTSLGPTAIADGLVVGDDLGSLALVGTKGPAHFLGYRTGTLGDLRPLGTHFLATDASAVIELDEKFHTYSARELQIDDDGRPWYGVSLLDKTHVLASHYANSSNGLFVVDLPSNKATLIAPRAALFGYQPRTRLLQYQVEQMMMVARFDPKTGTVGSPASLLLDRGAPLGLTLLDPDVSDGNVAALTQISDNNTRVHVTLIKSIDAGRADQFERGVSRDFVVDDEFWQSHTEAELVARMFGARRQASPDKQLSAELHGVRITLRDRDGHERWTVPSRGASTIVWTPDGNLVAYGSGIARLDLATGDMVDRQCGWRFGRWDMSPQTFGTAQQCEVP